MKVNILQSQTNEKDLTDAYYYQFTKGCDNISCSNTLCASCDQFVFSRVSNDKLMEYASKYAKNHQNEPRLCQSIKPCMYDKENQKKLSDFKESASKFVDSSIQSFPLQTILSMIEDIFNNYYLFCNILQENNYSYSLTNPNINDKLMLDLTSKLASIPNIDQKLFNLVSRMGKKILNQGSDAFNYYSNIRSLLLLFYFPAVITPQSTSELLNPLLSIFRYLSNAQLRIVIVWISILTNLRYQLIGDCHFSISNYFASRRNPDLHNPDIINLVDTLSIFHDANSYSGKPYPPYLFYNHHINEVIDIGEELELQRSPSYGPYSIINRPFILSLSTKSEIGQVQSRRLMSMMQFRTFINNLFTSGPQDDLFLTLYIRRDHLVDDTIHQLEQQSAYNFLKRLRIVFQGESAIDQGGPSREFFYLISESLFSPDYGMFRIVNNKYSWFTSYNFQDPRSYFLVGAIIGLAIHNGIVLPNRFPLVVYKRLLTPKKQLTVFDVNQIDPVVSKSLQQIQQMLIQGEDVSQLCLTFSITRDDFDKIVTVPLSNNIDPDTEVTNANANLYIQTYIQYLLVNSIKDQFEAFHQGFDFTCRIPIYHQVEPEEMDILVSGEEVLDWAALKRCAKYIDGYDENSKQVKWFWELFNQFSNEEKLMFLKFATGTDRVPVGGLGNMDFVIQRGADPKRLPISHTCFNTFTLPAYKNRKTLEKFVTMAIQQNEGFGFQ